MKRLLRLMSMLCIIVFVCSIDCMAKTNISQNFENATANSLIGAGKLFEAASSAGVNDVSIDTETNGTYTNKYLQIKPSSSQKVLLTSAGVINEGVTTISARMKFNGGNTTGFIIRAGSNTTYIAVNNGGGTALRLFNNAATALTIDYNKWYDLFYKIDLNAGTMYGKIKPVGTNDNSGVEATIDIKSSTSINSGSHIRIISDGTTAAPSNGVCIDNFVVSGANEPVFYASEDFEQFGTGNISAPIFSTNSGLRVPTTDYYNQISIAESDEGKCLKLTGNQNAGQPLIYTEFVPKGKSVVSFDAMTTADTYEFRAYIQTNSSNRLNLMQYHHSADGSIADFVSSMDTVDIELGKKIQKEFVHFDFVIDKGEGKSVVTAYINGKKMGTKTLGVEYSSIRFDVNTTVATANGAKSVMYLDNYRIYQMGTPQLDVQIPQYISNGDYVTLKSNNVIEPDTLTFNCPAGVTITPQTNDGKEYRLVFDGLVKNEDYTITTGNIGDIYGQSMGSRTISFKSTQAPEVEADIAYKVDGIECLNGKFASGNLDVTFSVLSNTEEDKNLKGYIVLYGDNDKCMSVNKVDIPLAARQFTAVPSETVAVSADVKKIKVFLWENPISPVCAQWELVPYTYDEIESVVPYYPGYTNKAVTFSYDDGIMGGDKVLVELFNKYNIKATFNIYGDKALEYDAEEYKAVYEGHEVANHSQTHPKINLESSGVTIEKATNDIIACRNTIEQIFGDEFDSNKWGFVWPYARPVGRKPESDKPFVEELEENIQKAGAVYIRPVSTTGKFDLPENWMLWEPTSKDDNMERYTDEFLADSQSGLRLLFLWGHASDLYQKLYGVGFEDLEETLQKLTAEGVNIWSATNMEIYDYVNAVNNIRISDDKTKIYNDADVDVYAAINGQKVIIPAKGYTAL